MSPESLAGKRVLVTGGAGFLGSHVVEALRARGASEVAVPRKKDYDLVEREACRRTCTSSKATAPTASCCARSAARSTRS